MARLFQRGSHGNAPVSPVTNVGADYATSLSAGLRLDPAVKGEVVSELCSHIRDREEELRAKGLSADEARGEALRTFGEPRIIARQLYEAYSRGSWPQAGVAALPHILFASLFALNWWRNAFWLSLALGVIMVFSAYGWWRRGKPNWLFPWLGYLLAPVIVAGALLLYLPKAWSWVAAVAYLPIAAWLVLRLGKQSIRRDWLFCSLMLLPAPAAASWVVALRWGKVLSLEMEPNLYSLVPWITVSFVALGAASALFVRIRQRWLKLGSLLAVEFGILALVGIASQGLGLVAWLLLSLAALVCLVGPALLEGPLRADGLSVRASDWATTGEKAETSGEKLVASS